MGCYIKIRPQESGEIIEAEKLGLELLQKEVGGYIEVVPTCFAEPPSEGPLVMVINEEGKLKGLPENECATDIYIDYKDVIVGDAVLCVADGEDLVPMSRDRAERILKELVIS